jgi:hypothetical protein
MRERADELELPIGTTLDEWKAEILRLYPTARFQTDATFNYHAGVGLFRKGSWYGGHDRAPSPHTQAWIKQPKESQS